MTMDGQTCACCGKPIKGIPTDWGHGMPKDAFVIPKAERRGRVEIIDGDLAKVDDAWYVRGMLYVRINGVERAEDDFESRLGLGLWVKMEYEELLNYAKVDDAYQKGLPVEGAEWKGIINATRVPIYPDLDGQEVRVRLNPDPTRRPNFFVKDVTTACYRDQTEGISIETWHRYATLMADAE